MTTLSMRNLGNALILSPFATHPLDAGQRKRAFQTTQFFHDLGFKITFLHFAFETRWYWGHNDVDDTVMKSQWGNDVIHFYAHQKVGLPPVNGIVHQLDEWWDDALGGLLSNIFSKRSFDLFVVHNIWLSKAFDYAPYDTLKALEMHDLFSLRAHQFRESGADPEFFYCSEEDELFGLRRADVALSIKAEDSQWCVDKGLSSDSIVSIPYSEASLASDISPVSVSSKDLLPISSGKMSFGVIGSDIHFNRFAVNNLICALDRVIRKTYAPIELILAGSICKSIGKCPAFVRKLGFVDTLDEFYSSVDVVVVPMTHGTGVKIKSVEAIAQSKPILFAKHSAEGTGYDGVVFESLDELSLYAASLSLASVIPSDLVDATYRAKTNQMHELERGRLAFISRYTKKRPSFLHILSASNQSVAQQVLGGVTGLLLFKQLSSWFRPLGLAIHPSVSEYLPTVPACPIPLIDEQETLMQVACQVQFIVVDMNELTLLDLIQDAAPQTPILLDCRIADLGTLNTFFDKFSTNPNRNVRFVVSPWVFSFLPIEQRHSVIVLPFVNDRFTWDPHLAFLRDLFLDALPSLPESLHNSIVSELCVVGYDQLQSPESALVKYDVSMAWSEFKDSVIDLIC